MAYLRSDAGDRLRLENMRAESITFSRKQSLYYVCAYLVRKQNIILIERSDDDLDGKPRDLAFNYKPSIQLHPLSSLRV